MHDAEASELIDYLGHARRVFHYFRGRYAFLLLERCARSGFSMSETRRSQFGRLLDKPIVREFFGRTGNAQLQADSLAAAWIEPALSFSISLGWWRGKADRFSQLSRTGWNLVLQLNFSNEHMRIFRRRYRPTRPQVFNFPGHPVRKDKIIESATETLAWARLDIDLDSGVALIEEIQSDWCRQASNALRYAKFCASQDWPMPNGFSSDGNARDVIRYIESDLRPYADCWDEAVLTAAIMFIRDEVGIKDIYYHSDKSGAAMKRIKYDRPPRSLYSTLPRRFAFKRTDDVPAFIRNDKSFRRLYKRIRPVSMHRLHLPA